MRAISYGRHAAGCDTAMWNTHYWVFHNSGQLPAECTYRCPGLGCKTYESTVHVEGQAPSREICLELTWFLWVFPVFWLYVK